MSQKTQADPSPVLDFFLGRQLILDRRQNLIGFELLFRATKDNEASVEDEVSATATVFNHVFCELGVETVLGRYRGYLNVSPSLLMSDVVELVPKDLVTLEITHSEAITPAVIERCVHLRGAGYKLALDEYSRNVPSFHALLPHLDSVKVDVAALDGKQLLATTKELKQYRLPLMAERVEQRSQAKQSLQLGYDYLQGHYFAKPDVLTGKRLSHSEMALIRLLGAVLADADTGEIVSAVKHHPDLTLRLLKLVNTAAVGANVKISSIDHAVTVLGRTQLKRWVQVLLFVGGGTPGVEFPSPLLVLAATRGRLMELIAERAPNTNRGYCEKAFLTGMLSLLGAQFGTDVEELIRHLLLDSDIEDALRASTGVLGALLFLTEIFDQVDFPDMQLALTDLSGVDQTDLPRLQLEAMRWATSIGESS